MKHRIPGWDISNDKEAIAVEFKATEDEILLKLNDYSEEPKYNYAEHRVSHHICYSCRKEIAIKTTTKRYKQVVVFCDHACLINYLRMIKWEDVEHRRIEPTQPIVKAPGRPPLAVKVII
jgi:hypothetical protein